MQIQTDSYTYLLKSGNWWKETKQKNSYWKIRQFWKLWELFANGFPNPSKYDSQEWQKQHAKQPRHHHSITKEYFL